MRQRKKIIWVVVCLIMGSLGTYTIININNSTNIEKIIIPEYIINDIERNGFKEIHDLFIDYIVIFKGEGFFENNKKNSYAMNKYLYSSPKSDFNFHFDAYEEVSCILFWENIYPISKKDKLMWADQSIQLKNILNQTEIKIYYLSLVRNRKNNLGLFDLSQFWFSKEFEKLSSYELIVLTVLFQDRELEVYKKVPYVLVDICQYIEFHYLEKYGRLPINFEIDKKYFRDDFKIEREK